MRLYTLSLPSLVTDTFALHMIQVGGTDAFSVAKCLLVCVVVACRVVVRVMFVARSVGGVAVSLDLSVLKTIQHINVNQPCTGLPTAPGIRDSGVCSWEGCDKYSLIIGVFPLHMNGLRLLGLGTPEASGDETGALVFKDLLPEPLHNI